MIYYCIIEVFKYYLEFSTLKIIFLTFKMFSKYRFFWTKLEEEQMKALEVMKAISEQDRLRWFLNYMPRPTGFSSNGPDLIPSLSSLPHRGNYTNSPGLQSLGHVLRAPLFARVSALLSLPRLTEAIILTAQGCRVQPCAKPKLCCTPATRINSFSSNGLTLQIRKLSPRAHN